MQMILRYRQSDFLEEFMANIYSTSGGALNYLRMISENLENNHFTISNSKNVMFALNYLNRFFGTTTEETVILTGLLSTKRPMASSAVKSTMSGVSPAYLESGVFF